MTVARLTSYQGGQIAYAFADVKLASIFFDHVVPLCPLDSNVMEGEVDDSDWIYDPLDYVLPNILPPNLQNRELFDYRNCAYAYLGILMSTTSISYLKEQIALHKAGRTKIDLQYAADALKRRSLWYEKAIRDVLEITGTDRISLFDVSEGLKSEIRNQGTVQRFLPDVCLALTNLKMIKTSELSWKHILELRRDEESVRKLRLFRIFLADTYTDRPASYIRDDILRRVDEYEETVKQWSIKTALATLRSTFSAKSIPAATAAGITAALGGGMPLALAIGAAFEIGQIGVTIAECKRELGVFRKCSPVSYLIELNKLQGR